MKPGPRSTHFCPNEPMCCCFPRPCVAPFVWHPILPQVPRHCGDHPWEPWPRSCRSAPPDGRRAAAAPAWRPRPPQPEVWRRACTDYTPLRRGRFSQKQIGRIVLAMNSSQTIFPVFTPNFSFLAACPKLQSSWSAAYGNGGSGAEALQEDLSS